MRNLLDDENDPGSNLGSGSDSFKSLDKNEAAEPSSREIELSKLNDTDYGKTESSFTSEEKGGDSIINLEDSTLVHDSLLKRLERHNSLKEMVEEELDEDSSDTSDDSKKYYNVDAQFSGIRRIATTELNQLERMKDVEGEKVPPMFVPGHRFLLHPESFFGQLWQVLIFLALLYSFYVLPYRVAFLQQQSNLHAMDLVIDSIFFMDIVLTFLTARRKRNGVLETEMKTIAKKYIRTWLIVDIVATFPYYLVDGGQAQVADSLLRLPRFSKALRLLRLLKISKSFKHLNIFSWYEYHPRIPVAAVRMFTLTIVVVSFAHFSACLWYFWGELYADDDSSWLNRMFGNGQRPIIEKENSEKYLMSIYWAFTTLTTVGYGDITPETPAEVMYGIVIMLSGACFFTYLTATVASLLSEWDRDKRIFREKLRNFERFCNAVGLSKSTQRKISVEMSAIWSHPHSTIHWPEIMAEVSEKHRLKIVSELFPDAIFESDIFEIFEGHNDFLKSFIASIEPRSYTSGQYIQYEGEVAEGLIIVRFGSLRLSWNHETGPVFYDIDDKDTVGETGLFLWPTMKFSIQAISRSSILMIPRDRLFDILAINDFCLAVLQERALKKQAVYDEHFETTLKTRKNQPESVKKSSTDSMRGLLKRASSKKLSLLIPKASDLYENPRKKSSLQFQSPTSRISRIPSIGSVHRASTLDFPHIPNFEQNQELASLKSEVKSLQQKLDALLLHFEVPSPSG